MDFTKGVLVLLMVLYHWMNYFVGVEGPVYPYLRFVPPSFIFISGFILANVYPTKYGLSNSKLYIRLLVRGLKILALFTLLNLAANTLFSKSYKGAMPGVEAFVSNAVAIYISGNGRMSFGVLIPISYLLLLSTIIFYAMQEHKYALYLACTMSFLAVALLDSWEIKSQNLSFVAIGILGMVCGQYQSQTITNWATHRYIVVCLYVGYIMAISILGEGYFLQVIGVCLSVMLIYIAGIRGTVYGPIGSTLILLGKYSLIGYIAQIGLLHLLQGSVTLLNLNNLWLLWIVSFVGAFALTIITVKVAHQILTKSHIAGWFYRVTFS